MEESHKMTFCLISVLFFSFFVIGFLILPFASAEPEINIRPLLPESFEEYENEESETYEYVKTGSAWYQGQDNINTSIKLIKSDFSPTEISVSQPEIKSPDTFSSFKGLDSTDNSVWVHPPDVQLAVGPKHVVEFVNRKGRIFNKTTGATISTFELSSFFSVPSGDDNQADPKIIYDNNSGRFFATYLSYDNKIFFTDIGRLYIAVSASNDPTGTWKVYRLDINDDFPDYPGIGLTDDKIVISYNRFDIDTSAYTGVQTVVVEKADLLAAASSARNTLSSIDSNQFTWRPAHSLSSTSTQWMVSSGIFSSSSTIYLLSINGTPASNNVEFKSVANISISQSLDSPPKAKQKNSSSTIDTNDNRILEVVWKNDKLWLSANDGCVPSGDSVTRACLRLIQINTDSKSILTDLNYETLNEYHYYPAIRPDTSNNLIVVYSSSSENKYIETRAITIVENNFTDSILLKIGESSYAVSPFRWGDYLGAAVDPDNSAKIWVAGQYAKTPQSGDPSGGGWGTWIAQIGFSPKFSSQSGPSTVELGNSTKLSVFWSDDVKIDKVILSTNETGLFRNYTDGIYNSPMSFNSTSGWSNFSWSNTSLSNGTAVSWRVYANDTSGNENATDIFTFTVIDTSGPRATNILQTNDTTYARNNVYTFNATLTEFTGISAVFLEWNGTENATIASFETVNATSRTYRANKTDLAAGNYTYRWVSNDTLNNFNVSATRTFNVTRATPTLSLVISPSNSTIYLAKTEANGSVTTGDSKANITLFRNGTTVNSTENIFATENIALGVGTHNYTLAYNGTQNFTSSSTANITRILPASTSISLFLNGTQGNATYDRGSAANITATINSTEGITLSLLANFTGASSEIGSSTSPVSNITNTSGITLGVFNITARYDGSNANYSTAFTTLFMIVRESFRNSSINLTKDVLTTVNATGTNITLDILVNDTIINNGTNITVGTDNPVNTTPPDFGIGKFIRVIASKNLENRLNYTVLKYHYSTSEIPSNVDESSLRLYRWNDTNWNKLNGNLVGGVNTTGKFVFANLTQFSNFTVAGLLANGQSCSSNSECSSGICSSNLCVATPQPSVSSSASSSGGGGGGGGGVAPTSLSKQTTPNSTSPQQEKPKQNISSPKEEKPVQPPQPVVSTEKAPVPQTNLITGFFLFRSQPSVLTLIITALIVAAILLVYWKRMLIFKNRT